MAVGIDAANCRLRQAGAGVLGQPTDREAPNLSDPERHSHGQWAVDELGLRAKRARQRPDPRPTARSASAASRPATPAPAMSTFVGMANTGMIADRAARRDPHEA